MSQVQENNLVTAKQFNRDVDRWSLMVRNQQVAILLAGTKGSRRLQQTLKVKLLDDRTGGPAVVGLGFKFLKYGAYREYGAGRGYVVKDGVIYHGHTEYASKIKRKELRGLKVSESRMRSMKTTYDTYEPVKRTPLPWLDRPIVTHIDKLADTAGEYYGDHALKSVLKNFNKITIERRYGKE